MCKVDFSFSWVLQLCTSLVYIVWYVHHYIYQPLMSYGLKLTFDVSEELSKSIVRESFNHIIRFVNGVFVWIVAFWDKATEFKTSTQDVFPSWQNLRPSSLNWFIDQDSPQPITAVRRSEAGVNKPVSSKGRWWWRKDRKKSFMEQSFVLRNLLERHTGIHLSSQARHRGLVEECQLALEKTITTIFKFGRKLAAIIFLIDFHSPPKTASRSSPSSEDSFVVEEGNRGLVRRGKSMPVLRSEMQTRQGPITARHFITEAGYPQESHSVTTDDGYIMCLHRLPRKGASNTVFFQHGVLDTALGWVSGGITRSLAFAIWEQGYDVWLGNSRSNPPRKHVQWNLKQDEYWRYSLNELGIKDIGAQISYIHQIKCKELKTISIWSEQNLQPQLHGSVSEQFLDHLSEALDPPLEDNSVLQDGHLPYSLRVVGHSLGAAALLIYLVTCLYRNQDHYIRKMILMSPAGFHHVYPPVAYPLRWTLPPLTWFMEKVLGRRGAALMIPGSYTRLIFFKILQDAVQIPAIREFMKIGIRWLMNGDVSPWEYVMQLPHYDVEDMPGIAVHTGIHLIQLLKSGRFQLFDYGSEQENLIRYGLPHPLDLAAEYWRIKIPVDIISGHHDGVIPPVCVKRHVEHMLDKGVKVTHREFEYGHLEFSNTVAHDLQMYILDRLEQF